MRTRRTGLTLVELLGVIAVLAVGITLLVGASRLYQGLGGAAVGGRVSDPARGGGTVQRSKPGVRAALAGCRIPAVSLTSPTSCSNGSRMRHLRKSAKSGTEWATEESS